MIKQKLLHNYKKLNNLTDLKGKQKNDKKKHFRTADEIEALEQAYAFQSSLPE